jgi:acetyl esterase/lipase
MAKTIYDMKEMMRKMNAERMACEVLPQNLEAHMDIVYNKDAKAPYGALDVFRPLTKGKLPVIIDIHGGGFCEGEKDINENYCRHLALEGFVTVNVAYELVPDVTVDVQLRQCQMAFKWVQDHIAEYGGDLNNVFATGDSAGGYLVFYSAAISKSELLRELVGTVDAGINIRAIGMVCPKLHNKGGFGSDVLEGVMFRKEDLDKPFLQYIGTPKKIYEIGANVPVWYMTTELDMIRDMCLLLDKELGEVGAEYEFIDLPQPKDSPNQLRHVFNVTRPDWQESQEINHKMCEFFRRYMA